jgi:hypothetical protein
VGLAVKYRQLARQVGVFIEYPPENSMVSFNFTSAVLDEATTFVFGSWVCIANGSGGYNSRLADTKEPEAPTTPSRRDADDLVDGLNGIQFSDLIRNHASHLRAIRRPQVNADTLIAGVDWVDRNIAACIKLAEAALQHFGNQLPPISPEISRTFFSAPSDIYSSIDRVDGNIAECIRLVETSLQLSNKKQPEAAAMDVNRAIDDFIDNLEPLESSPPRSEVLYHKSISELEENLDRLLQVGGGLATVYRRAPVSVDYSNFNDDALPLSSGHQGLRASSTWSGGLGYRKGTESSNLSDPSLPSCAISLVRRAWVSKGHSVLQAT